MQHIQKQVKRLEWMIPDAHRSVAKAFPEPTLLMDLLEESLYAKSILA